MALSDQVLALSEQILDRLGQSHDFYKHTRQAWRLVQQLAHTGHSVGIVDALSNQPVPVPDLEQLAQLYVTNHLPVAIFKSLSSILEDWVIGLIRLRLEAHPEDLDPDYDRSTGRSRKKKGEETQIPLSLVLRLPDRDAILRHEIDRVVRSLSYKSMDDWFSYLERRLTLGYPTETEKAKLKEMKAARDVLEHNRGVVNHEYLSKTESFSRYADGDEIQIDEPYLLSCFELLQQVVKSMTGAVIQAISDPLPPQ